MGDDIYCMPANTKYPDVLDPVREEAKAERRSIMGKFAKYFAPHTAQDRSAYEPNVFSYNLRDPVKPNARDPR